MPGIALQCQESADLTREDYHVSSALSAAGRPGSAAPYRLQSWGAAGFRPPEKPDLAASLSQPEHPRASEMIWETSLHVLHINETLVLCICDALAMSGTSKGALLLLLLVLGVVFIGFHVF